MGSHKNNGLPWEQWAPMKSNIQKSWKVKKKRLLMIYHALFVRLDLSCAELCQSKMQPLLGSTFSDSSQGPQYIAHTLGSSISVSTVSRGHAPFDVIPCSKRTWRYGDLKSEKPWFSTPLNMIIRFLFSKFSSSGYFTEGRKGFSGFRNLSSRFCKPPSLDVVQLENARRMRLFSRK